MEQPISRSEKKRRARNLENLSVELVELSKIVIQGLPCDDFLKKEISRAASLKGSSRKRQIKYITKNLRQIDPAPLLDFLADKKGSQLKESTLFHEIEKLRDDILAEAFECQKKARKNDVPFTSDWHSTIVPIVIEKYPSLDAHSLKDAAARFAVTTRPTLKRELFRMIKAAHDKSVYENNG